MQNSNNSDLWKFQKAVPATVFRKTVLGGLMIAGVLCIARFFDWWFREEHIVSLPLFVLLTFLFWWGILRMIILWVCYFRIKVPVTPPVHDENLSVAIFTTSSPGEPLSMFDKTLEACSKITYPHKTYLLDDTRDERFREVAEKHGAVWLELVGIPGAKAGKINEALKRTKEDYILVLDPDHIPFPNFFDEVLGYFKEEKIGYVQVAQAYYNQYRSFTATAAAEQTYSFYGPTQMGMNGYNASVAIGANCTFRRKALESIGGHGIGLAEDLITAIRIHSKKWKSVYNPVIISRGLVPEDLGSFCKQQLKWSRGVHEVLFAEVPQHWKNLSFWQRISYFTIGSYYIAGLIMFLFIFFPYLFLWFGIAPANMKFVDFIIHWTPMAIVAVVIYLYAQQWLVHPTSEKGFHWRGMFLKFSCWHVFLKGFLLSLWNAEIPYIPTAKKAVSGLTRFARPLIIHQVLFLATIVLVVMQRIYFTPEAKRALTSGEIWGMVAFALIAFVMTLGGTYAAVESQTIKSEEPWSTININEIDPYNREKT
ncbi:MAG: glycosyltransferase [Chitinophagaceae bacterium]